MTEPQSRYVKWFDELGVDDVPSVGGKNASLGEMIQKLREAGIAVPQGFATTADAYRDFLDAAGLTEKIRQKLAAFDRDEAELKETGRAIRELILQAELLDELREAIGRAYRQLSEKDGRDEIDVAVRSSATAEDLPTASFAGQQETYLNIRGEAALLDACRRCIASLFTDRAISYRQQRGFDHMQIALSVGVQKMVRSDKGSAGVAFTIDTETGFPDVVLIDGAWGLGESVVKGTVTPDEFRVFKPLLDDERLRPIIEKHRGEKQTKMIYADGGDDPTTTVDTTDDERSRFCLDDDQVLKLARWAKQIEQHYGQPMDIEWAVDGESGEMFIVQARPETVQSQRGSAALKTYRLKEKGDVLVEGQAIGSAISSGPAKVIKTLDEAEKFEQGAVLITERTDPDWVPLMKRAAAVVTAHGGRTSHAAIVSRELGLAAIVGAADATEKVPDGEAVTVDCAEGQTGIVYRGELEYEEEELDLEEIPETRTKVMMNLASPDAALRWWALRADGVGLARMEFIVNNIIKIHPLALIRFDELEDDEVREQVEHLTAGYGDKADYFVDNLARGIAMIAAGSYPHPVIVRLSDFKTNEYANLIGGEQFEPDEENPMLGFRGASRYYSDLYRDGFALECRALKRAREEIGLDNIVAMIPFCRTPEEGDRVLEAMAQNGLRRGERDFKVYVMAEIPSNIILADEFAERFDGFSVGSNDLAQLVFGVDRDSDLLAHLFDDRHRAVRGMIGQLIESAHAHGLPVGLCGQAPSDYPEYADFLVEAGIDSISVIPDSVVAVRQHVAKAEAKRTQRVTAGA